VRFDIESEFRAWLKSHGVIAIAKKTDGPTGRTFIGVLTTKTLVIAGDGGVHSNAQGQTVALLRAYDKSTGEDIPGEVNMPAKQTGSPMSYMHNGKQYIVIAVSGQGFAGAEILAYALP
jgi:quinoprotein glucose dehydrogenase